MDWKDLKKSFIKINFKTFEKNYPDGVNKNKDNFDKRYKYFLLHKSKYYSVKDIVRHSVEVWNESNSKSKINWDKSSRLIGGKKSNDGAGLFLEKLGFRIVLREELIAKKKIKHLFGESVPTKIRNASIKTRQRCYEYAEYILNKANGICQNCNSPAPFKKKKNNTPYLEAHHMDELSKGGIDHPDNMVALCPNCHVEIHRGKNGEAINEALKVKYYK